MSGSTTQSDAGAVQRGRAGGIIKRFLRAREGATAVEFGIIMTPFMLLLFAIIETVMMLWTNAVLEEAVSEVSRTLLTGQSQTLYAGANAATFRTNICNYAPIFIDCGRFSVDVKTYGNFASASSGSSLAGVIDTSAFAYRQPQPGEIVVVRGVLTYEPLLSQWSNAFAATKDGSRALVTATVFQTEPFTVASGLKN